MRSIVSISLFCLIMTFLSCSEVKENSNNFEDQLEQIPQLLERHSSLWQDGEWQHIQNLYGNYRASMLSKTGDFKSKLDMADLFINEARVTGEHGHYYPAALQMTEGVIQSVDPSDKSTLFRALMTKASVELSQHEFSTALETGKKAVAINPFNANIYGVLVDAYVEQGDYQKAVEMADKMISIRPDLRSYARVSYLREIHGDIEGAIEAMEMAITAGYPGQEATCWARMTMGELLELYGDQEGAKKQYEMALKERPDYPFAIAALADIELARKNYDEAETLLKKACAIIPEVSFFESLAHLYKAQSQGQALAEAKKIIMDMLDDDIKSGHNMNMEFAQLYQDLYEDPAKALIYVQKEYQKRPDNIDVNRMMASIYSELGEDKKAQFHFQKASTTNSRHPELEGLRKELAMME